MEVTYSRFTLETTNLQRDRRNQYNERAYRDLICELRKQNCIFHTTLRINDGFIVEFTTTTNVYTNGKRNNKDNK